MTFADWITHARELADAWETHRGAVCGVRVLPDNHQRPRLGQTDDIANSYDWYEAEYGSGERIKLDGTCALYLNTAKEAAAYAGRYVVLLAGSSSSGGTDAGEQIIRDARAVSIFDRETGATEDYA